MKNSSVGIFQYEAEFTIFKGTTCKSFREVEFCLNWSNSKVVELSVSWHCNCCVQKTCLSIFCDIYSYNCVHWIVINVCICSGFFTYSVSVCTYSGIWDWVKLNWTISCILFSLDNITVFKQFECEGISFKSLTFQTFCEAELCLCCSRCESIVELSICWKRINSFKNMTSLSNSDCYFSFHWVILHTSFWTTNFFNSVLVSTNLCICECQIVKGDHTASIVSLSLKNSSVGILQLESELTIFKSTTCKCFSEVKFSLNRSYNVVVKDFVICAWSKTASTTVFNICLQITRSILSNRNGHGYFHSIIIDILICICAFYFSDSVSISTYFIKWQFREGCLTVFICDSFFHTRCRRVFLNLKAEFTIFKDTAFQLFFNFWSDCYRFWFNIVVNRLFVRN